MKPFDLQKADELMENWEVQTHLKYLRHAFPCGRKEFEQELDRNYKELTEYIRNVLEKGLSQ